MTAEVARRVWRRAPLVLAAAAAILVAATVVVLGPTGANAADAPVDLATAANFSVLAGSTVTNTGPTTLAQSLGVHPGSAVTGFPPGLVAGETHLGDAQALQAKNDLTAAYNDAAGRTPFTNLASELGGTTLIPGVYRIGAAQVTGQLTLNAQGNSQAVFIFQISSTLITAPNSSVVFINGASPCNVYWQVTSSATIGTGTTFVGNIMALAAISMNTGATLEGRALAQTEAVTLQSNVISEPLCIAASASTTPTATTGVSASVGPTTAPPTVTPTVPPTATPTAPATATPTVPATATPTVPATATPTVPATATPTVPATATPTVPATATPTVPATATPTVPPTATATVPPTATPTSTPTATATATATPTASPTAPPPTGLPTTGGPGPTGPRTPPVLPVTGDSNAAILTIAGLFLIVLGGLMFARYRRRANES